MNLVHPSRGFFGLGNERREAPNVYF